MKAFTALIALALIVYEGGRVQGDPAAAAAAAAANFEGKMADQAKNLHKFMPNPTGPGFRDKGMTGEAEFTQMDRFGIPDLNNPTAHELTDLNFDKAIEGEQYVAVLFYSPTMDEYDYYALHWEKASMELAENIKAFTTAKISMARLDISEPEHQDIALTYGISLSTPDMRLFFNSTHLTAITSPVSHQDIRQFIIAQTIPSVTQLVSDLELKKWKRRKVFNQANLKFLAHASNDDPDALSTFKSVASDLKAKVQFAYVTDLALFRSPSGVDIPDAAANSIYLLRDFATPKIIPFPTHDRPFSLDSVVSFIDGHNTPWLTNLADKDEHTVRLFLEHKKPFRALAFFKTNAMLVAATPALEALARDFHDDVLVAYTVEDPEDATNFDYQFWDVPSDKPALLVVHMKRDRKFLLSTDTAHDLTNMRTFVADVLAKRATAELKSQTPPTPNTGLVRVVVTNTWEDEVKANDKQDVLVLLTKGPSHPPSRWMLRHMERFAKVWRRDPRLLVATMDMTKNDLMELEDEAWTALPKLYFVPRTHTGASPFDIELHAAYPTMEMLMEFVRTHQSHELVVDEKVWTRLHAEDKEALASHKAKMANGDDVHAPDDILKELEMELKKAQGKEEADVRDEL
ncbi:hypothetical protein B5M09_000572 [Aphanomyces astaci]|uniref:Thioredoxin domain-containing protein n=1 Tax=Aphanomyces astaci TaxID=112090 RepID=A0A3R7WJF8_APHAT|nr:hypothetical protein B5M09_000572 [Aphanomyces astaci]